MILGELSSGLERGQNALHDIPRYLSPTTREERVDVRGTHSKRLRVP